MLDHSENLEESKIKLNRDTKLDEIANNKQLKDNCLNILSKKDSWNGKEMALFEDNMSFSKNN